MIVKPAGAATAFRSLNRDCRLVLLFGPDEAQARDLAARAVAASGIDPADPFAAVTLTPEQIASDPARLLDEALALSFLGGRKLVSAHGLTDAAAGAIDSLLGAPEAGNLVIATAGDLPKRSKLRLAAEAHPQAIAIVCYADARGVRDLLASEAQRLDIRLDGDAASALLEAVGDERGLLRQELEKLALYCGAGGRVSAGDVEALVAGAGSAGYDRLLKALFDGDGPAADAALAAARADGEAMVALLRAAQRRTLQLMRLRVLIAGGASAGDAVRQVQPPIFWKEQDSVAAQGRRISYAGLDARLARLVDAEIAVKTGGGDDAGGQALLALARMG